MVRTIKKNNAKIHHHIKVVCSNGLVLEGHVSNNNRCPLLEILCDKEPFIEMIVDEESVFIGKQHIVHIAETPPPPDAYTNALQLFGLRGDSSLADVKSAYVRMSKRYDVSLLEEMAADASTLAEARRMSVDLKQAFVLLQKRLSAAAQTAPEDDAEEG